MMTYLEQLLDHCASLKLVLNPPHPQAFIQGRADQAQILLAELEKEVAEIEKQDAPTFETVTLYEIDFEDLGGWQSILVPVGFEPECYTKMEMAQEEFEEVELYRRDLLGEIE